MPVSIPEWVRLTARGDEAGGFVVEGACARCSVPLDLPEGMSRADTERALGAFARLHARCRDPEAGRVVQRALERVRAIAEAMRRAKGAR